MSARERHAVRALAATEFRARLRRIRGDPRKLLGTAVSVLALSALALLIGVGPLTAFGRRLAGGTPPRGAVGVAVSGVATATLYLGGASVSNQSGVGRLGPLVRTATTPRAVVAGRAGAAFLVGALVAVVPALVVAALVVVGAGGPLAPLALLVGLVPVALAGAAGGRAVGAVGRLVARRIGLSGWARAGVGILALGVLLVVTQSATRRAVDGPEAGLTAVVPPAAVLPGAPLQAYGAFVLVPIGGTAHPLGAAVAAGAVVATLAGAVVAVRAEVALLVTDEDGAARTGRTRAVPGPLARTVSTRVAWRYLVRTRRNPATMSHLFPVAIGFFSFLASAVTGSGFVLSLGPGVVVVLAGVLAGATYSLNPLGDDRDQLPLVLTSARSTAVLLRGRAIAGALIGLTLVVFVGAPLDVALNSPGPALARTSLGVVFVAAAPGTALLFGAAVPAFERREYLNVDRAHPSMLVLFVYLSGGAVVGAAGLALATWTVTGGGLAAGLAWLVYLPVLVVPSVGGYLYAVRRFDGLDLDET
jgi:hypothetical protein